MQEALSASLTQQQQLVPSVWYQCSACVPCKLGTANSATIASICPPNLEPATHSPPCRSSNLLQPNISARSSYSTASSSSHAGMSSAAGSAAPAAADRGGPSPASMPPAGRSNRQLPLSASSNKGSAAAEAWAMTSWTAKGSPAGMLAPPTRSVNRTPLLNKSAALEPKDDSITVGNAAGLAVLLGGKGGAAAGTGQS